MSEIVVWGVVPVGIHVDTETNEVKRVVVIDEDLRYPQGIDTPVMEGDLAVSNDGYQQPWGACETDADVEAAREKAAEALEFARGDSGIWPAWEFGY